MPDSVFSKQVQRGGRFVVPTVQSARLTIESDDCQEELTCLAQVVDLSPHGAKLAVSQEIPEGELTRMRLVIDQLNINFQVAADVCWTQHGDDDNWLIGCSLDPQLPTSLFRGLTSDVQAERRFDPRTETSLQLLARWDLAGHDVSVKILNYSRGGFCVFSDKPVDFDRRLHLSIGGEVETVIIAHATWQLEATEGIVVGCSFLREKDFERFASVASDQT